IESLDDHDARPEQGVVRGIASLLGALRLDRQVVDPDEQHATLDAPLRRRRADRDDVPGEVVLRVAPERAVAGLEEDAWRFRLADGPLEPLAGDARVAVIRNDCARADERFERQLIRG